MGASPSHKDTSINEECNKPTSSDGRSTVFAVAGDCVSLSCDKARSNCSNITWLFSYNHTMTVELVEKGKVTSEDNQGRLHVTKECSLEVKKLRKVDGGQYTCRFFPSSGGEVDHAVYDLELMTNTSRPTPTTVKETTSTSKPTTTTVKETTSTSKPTTTTVKGAASTSTAARPSTSTPTTHTLNAPTAGVLLRVLVLLGFSILTLVVLLRLIGWWRTRGNRAATEECIGLNSASDPAARERLGPGASDEQQHTVDMDLDWAPRGPSVVQRGGQRAVGSAQDQVDPGEISDAATYENLRAPPRCVGDTADTGVHFVTVHQPTK